MTPPADGPAVSKWLMVLLVIGATCGVGQMSITGRESFAVGQDRTTRFTRGLPFSPWYEEVETRTAAGTETRSTVRWVSLSWPAMLGGLACVYLIWRWRWRPARR